MNKYNIEKRSFPHPRSSDAIMSLAKIRGSYSGNHYAEAFMVNGFYYK